MIIVGSICIALATGLLWLAYGYQPASDRSKSPWAESAGMQYVEIDGYRIAYVEKGAGPVLLLLHGGGTWSYSWRHQIAPLAEAGYRVIAFDMPGHGFTTRNAGYVGRYDLQETNHIIEAVMDKLNVDQAILVGNSWGGGWALSYAQTHPNRVSKMVLIGAAGVPHETLPIWEWMKVPVVGEILAKFTRRSDIRQGLEQAMADPALVKEQDVDEAERALRQPENSLAQIYYMRDLDWSLTEARLPKTPQPTLIIWGEQDQYVPIEVGQTLAAKMPNARIAQIANAGHVAHEEEPDQLNKLVLEFAAARN